MFFFSFFFFFLEGRVGGGEEIKGFGPFSGFGIQGEITGKWGKKKRCGFSNLSSELCTTST